MKFTKIRLIGLVPVDLPVVHAKPSDQFTLKDADGLGPPEVDVSIASTLNTGGVYQGRRPQSRQPVFRIGLNPDYRAGQTVGDLRNELYGMLTPGYPDVVQVQIMNDDTIVAVAEGYVKNLTISPFSKDPEAQLTIDCLQPYLEAPDDLYVEPGGTKAAPVLTNAGSAPTGFHMELNLTADMPSLVLFDALNVNKMQFDYAFKAGDKLAFDTRPGSRGVWLTRDLLTTNIIYAFSADSTWFLLYGGDNTFHTNSQAFTWGDVYYRPKYWGI